MNAKESVTTLAHTVIRQNENEVRFLCNALGVTEDQVIDAWVLWDTGINEYDNTVYASEAMRIAMHLHNRIPGNWHDKRQAKILEVLQKIHPASMVEIGFGTPQRYVFDYILKEKKKLTLADFDDEALSFARVLLDGYGSDWKESVELRHYDMNSNGSLRGFDCYLLQDSVEHASDPTAYLRSLVTEAKQGAKFLLSLPIEIDKPVPEHNVFWRDLPDAISWLEKGGLAIEEHHEISMDKNLDLFARFLHPEFKEVIVLATKS